MSDEFYVAAWSQRVNELGAERAEAVAELERAKAQGDYHSAGHAIERIADIDARGANLVNIQRQYEQSQAPAPRQRRADVDLTPDEAARICGVSAEEYNRGVEKLLRFKALGMYRE